MLCRFLLSRLVVGGVMRLKLMFVAGLRQTRLGSNVIALYLYVTRTVLNQAYSYATFTSLPSCSLHSDMTTVVTVYEL